MARFAAGDQVVCQVRNRCIVSMYDSEYDEQRVFEIISVYDEGYFVYVPLDVDLRDTIYIDKSNYAKMNINKRFCDSDVYYITDFKVLSVYKQSDGLCCNRCGDFFYMSA